MSGERSYAPPDPSTHFVRSVETPQAPELRSAGRPRAAVPTWALVEREFGLLWWAEGPCLLRAGS